jgi:hypothetical protein
LVDGFENGPYVVRLKLKFHVPEYLPIWGKKARVYYHGIPIFCGSCHDIGHSRAECGNKAVTWTDYIKNLAGTGIPLELFGSWLASNLSNTREAQQNIPQPNFNENESESESDSDDEEIDLKKIPPKMLKLLKKLKVSTPKSSAKKSEKKETKDKSSDKNSERKDPKDKSNKKKSIPDAKPPKGRGRGIPFKPKRGRGRGRA